MLPIPSAGAGDLVTWSKKVPANPDNNIDEEYIATYHFNPQSIGMGLGFLGLGAGALAGSYIAYKYLIGDLPWENGGEDWIPSWLKLFSPGLWISDLLGDIVMPIVDEEGFTDLDGPNVAPDPRTFDQPESVWDFYIDWIKSLFSGEENIVEPPRVII